MACSRRKITPDGLLGSLKLVTWKKVLSTYPEQQKARNLFTFHIMHYADKYIST
ncbi:hypothetical protein SOVF_165470 [Spinacia oleracea]|nr:hypothetical protein SOVF_165470 [Spinacia oleracea]